MLMQVEISRNALHNALATVKRVASKRDTIPILSNVLLSAAAETLTLQTTDLDVVSTIRIPCETIQAGEMTVSAHSLADFVKSLGADAQIRLDETKDGAAIVSGASRLSLPTLPFADFPQDKDVEYSHAFEMPATDLRRLLSATSYAISSEETRYYLNGIYFHVADDKLRGVATDGHRLASADVALPLGAAGMESVIFPSLAVNELARLLAKHKGDVGVRVSRLRVEFTVGASVLTTKTIDGTFPDYRRVIPRVEIRATVSRAALIGLCKLVDFGRGTITKFEFCKNVLKATSTNADLGAKSAQIEYQGEAQGYVGLNNCYLVETLGAVGDDVLTWGFVLRPKSDEIDECNPLAFDCAAKPGEIFVIMPCRV